MIDLIGILLQVYLQEHDNELSKLVLSGTPNYMRCGAYLLGKSRFAEGRVFLSDLKETQAGFSWISVSEKNNAYINDPLCGYFTKTMPS